MSQKKTDNKKLFGGVAVLMPAALFTKVVGLFYKIPLIAIVGVAGMAYFLAAYHLYSFVFVLAATGLPTALSLLVSRAVAAEDRAAARRTLFVATLLFLCIGGVGTALLFGFAPAFAARLAMPGAKAAIVAIAPALLLSALIGTVKGYFQGLQQMAPTAVSEATEALGKLGFGLLFALMARQKGSSDEVVAAAAVFGITAGLALAALLLWVWLLVHLVRHRREGRAQAPLPSRRHVLRELGRLALPITLNAAVMGAVTLLDTALISARLQSAGFAPPVANAMYSSYGNLALPLYNLVPALLTPVTLSLMPLLSGALSKGDRAEGERALGAAFRFTALLAIPAALGLGVFARPILALIYGRAGEAVALAAPLLTVLSLSVLPVSLIALLGAALQAVGHTLTPVLAMGVGAVVKLLLEAVLLGVPGVHILGAPVSTLCCNLTVMVIEAVALGRALPFSCHVSRALLRPLLASALGVGSGVALYALLIRFAPSGAWTVLPVLACTALLYGVFALRMGAVSSEDLLALPAGERLCRLLQRLKFIK